MGRLPFESAGTTGQRRAMITDHELVYICGFPAAKTNEVISESQAWKSPETLPRRGRGLEVVLTLEAQ